MNWRCHHHLKTFFSYLLIPFFLVSAGISVTAQEGGMESDPGYQAGLSLYEANCTSCHKLDEALIGPKLRGVSAKYETEWLYSWIKNSQKMVKSGDPIAVKIFNDNKKSVMTAFPMLKDEDIDNILTYIDNAPVAVAAAGGAGGEVVDPCGPAEEAAGFFSPPKEWTPQNLFLLALTIALLVISTIDESNSLGYQQGYAPEQPIKFSHKLHACQYEIDCQYCHSGASKGKSAVIPSTNVCMNCHKGISEGPVYGKTEIQKIYDRVGWDPEEQQYDESKITEGPVEWVRIHNLPDHVYFNHSQHV